MSHEIRAPMNGVIGLTELALSSSNPVAYRSGQMSRNIAVDTLVQPPYTRINLWALACYASVSRRCTHRGYAAAARRQLLGRKPRSHTWLCSTIALPLELTCGDTGDAPHPGGKWLTEENMVRGNLARVDARPDDL
jgi:hypothetical protein